MLKQQPEADVHLIMAGGYDKRVAENVEYHTELVALVEEKGLTSKVTFLRSFSNSQKNVLLRGSSCLLYTPANEHFGIVPIEAMGNGCPVIAMNSGGPLETVADGETGFLCANDPQVVAKTMMKFIGNKEFSKSLGDAGKKLVESKFSFSQMTDKIDLIVKDVISQQ